MTPSSRPTTRRVALLAAAAGLLVAAGPSGAAPPPVAAVAVAGPQAATTGFPPLPVLSVQGQALTFTNSDLTGHDITSKATRPVRIKYGRKYYVIRVPLFRSESVPAGGSKDVKGVTGLRPGTYEFFCSLHTSMKGSLIVQAGA